MQKNKTIADISRSELLIEIFSSKHQIPMDMITQMSSYQLKRVRKIASGDISDMCRGDRIKALRVLSSLGRSHDCIRLGRIIGNKKEEIDIRTAAAVYLSSFTPKTAEPELIKHLKVDNNLIVSKVIKSLGNIGGPAAFKALSRMKSVPEGFVEKQLAFAKALIAYRLDLDDDPMPFVKGVARRPGTKDQTMTLTIKRAQPRSVQTALKQLQGSQYGMVPATKVGFAVTSGKAKWMLFINEKSAEQGISQSMRRRKLILGVLTRWINETGTYDAQYAILTKPVDNKEVQIMLVRTDGTVMYSGKATAKDKALSFIVTDTKRPGTSKTNVSGEFTEKGINIQAGITLFKRTGKLSPSNLGIKDFETKFAEMKNK